MEYKNLTIEIKNHICLLTLNHPPVNAVDIGMREELNAAIDELEKKSDVWVLVITGSGDKAFSAGMDVKDFANITKGPHGSDICTKVDRFPKPVIAAMNGFAYGGGFELAMSCHFRFMIDDEKAKVGLTELDLGIMPGWGGTQRLTRLIGRTKALEMILLGKRLSANEALEMGIIDRISARGEALKDAMEFAEKLAKRAPIAASCVIKSINAGLYYGIEEGLKTEREVARTLRDTEDTKEGMTAFLEKREPVFKGK
jgi:enoyl-CoA hydratase/carnithine racemase